MFLNIYSVQRGRKKKESGRNIGDNTLRRDYDENGVGVLAD